MKLVKNARKTIKIYRDYFNATVTARKPEKTLTKNIRHSYGRNNTGSITVRHRSRGAKTAYRQIAFTRKNLDTTGIVRTIEYDPNRTAFIALVEYPNKKKEYILSTEGMRPGDTVFSSEKTYNARPGSTTKLINIPHGTMIHSIESFPGSGGRFVRSAGAVATMLGISDKGYAIIRLPSKAVILLHPNCAASIGQLSNSPHINRKMYKAGNNRHRGVRPTVRGTAQNPVSHPHGGGEGRTGCKRHPVSYKGKLAKGGKTANENRPRAKFIVSTRSK